ncbi:MAG: hypothetical protein MJY78_03510 [Fibrobacter sp.]|nr:hypothetical protein [Fibrobacter sp.]
MRFIAVMLLAFVLTVNLSGCGSDSSSESGVVESSSSELVSSSATNAIVGSYSGYRELSEDEKSFFEEVVKGYEKELFDPELVSTQVVAGINYRFLCSMKDGNATSKVIVTIYKPLSGDSKITSVEEAPES